MNVHILRRRTKCFNLNNHKFSRCCTHYHRRRCWISVASTAVTIISLAGEILLFDISSGMEKEEDDQEVTNDE